MNKRKAARLVSVLMMFTGATLLIVSGAHAGGACVFAGACLIVIAAW